MIVNTIDPIKDPRWEEFLAKHPAASVFHTPEWLDALQRTYSYEPIVFTTSRSGNPLTNGIPFCRISSWLGGRRLVSLPFSDYCVPLAEDSEQVNGVLAFLRESAERRNWSRVEIRATDKLLPGCDEFEKNTAFFLHKLDLGSSLEEIFRNFHRDCVQRKIRRATHENLTLEEGTSEVLLTKFYGLLLRTRRRHGLPPQPLAWFRNLLACLGKNVRIRIALKDGLAVAAILTLQYKQTVVYKYGCSDERHSQVGGIQMLLWKAIQDAKRDGLSVFDMGRTEYDNPGLVTFKDRWGASRTGLVYLQYPRTRFHSVHDAAPSRIARRIFACMPDGVLSATGRLLYKYMG